MGTEERISAETALRIGLVSEVVARDDLWARANDIAGQIAARNPQAIQGTIRAIWESLDMTRSTALQNGMAYTHIGNPRWPSGGPRRAATGGRPTGDAVSQDMIAPRIDSRQAKLAGRAAEQIVADVIELGWPVGQVLGSEAELLERYGVSRAVLREAVRLVEHQRVARMRRGTGGGLVIDEPDIDAVIGPAIIYLLRVDATLDQIFDTRILLEELAAELASQRAARAIWPCCGGRWNARRPARSPTTACCIRTSRR